MYEPEYPISALSAELVLTSCHLTGVLLRLQATTASLDSGRVLWTEVGDLTNRPLASLSREEALECLTGDFDLLFGDADLDLDFVVLCLAGDMAFSVITILALPRVGLLPRVRLR